MKIRVRQDEVPFADIERGHCFWDGDQLCMRFLINIEREQKFEIGDNVFHVWNAISLSDGCPLEIPDDKIVRRETRIEIVVGEDIICDCANKESES